MRAMVVLPFEPALAFSAETIFRADTHTADPTVVSPTEIHLAINPRVTGNDGLVIRIEFQKITSSQPAGVKFLGNNQAEVRLADQSEAILITVRFLPGDAPANRAILNQVANTLQIKH